ncbi:hypothetical protein BSKO_00413 [Bryopsis sp. KO-2023]|nr:hypothetical protein BSKO_00413 [Bryopsis sp. KO-2023]
MPANDATFRGAAGVIQWDADARYGGLLVCPVVGICVRISVEGRRQDAMPETRSDRDKEITSPLLRHYSFKVERLEMGWGENKRDTQQHQDGARSGRMYRNETWPGSLMKGEEEVYYSFEQFNPEGGTSTLQRRYSNDDVPSDKKKKGHGVSLSGSPRSERSFRQVVSSRTMWFIVGLFLLGVMGFAPTVFDTLSDLFSTHHAGPARKAEEEATPWELGLRSVESRAIFSQSSRVLTDHEPEETVESIGYLNRNVKPNTIEFMAPGLFVPTDVALNLSLWQSSGVVYHDPAHPVGPYNRRQAALMMAYQRHAADKASREAAGRKEALKIDKARAQRGCPTGIIRVLVAVVARCCGSGGFSKRQAIRNSWKRIAEENHSDNIDVRFFIAQPPTAKAFQESYLSLNREAAAYKDIVVLPGPDAYLELPRKVLEIMRFGIDSPCKYTHVLKIDDDCYLRTDNLIDLINTGSIPNGSYVPTEDEKAKAKKKNVQPPSLPWMENLYAGMQQGAWEGEIQGFYPERNRKSKWFLSQDEFPEKIAPLGAKYNLGWGYLLSRDLVEYVLGRVDEYLNNPTQRPGWWGVLPWEDTMIGTMLRGRVDLINHLSFKAAWNTCTPDTLVKHLDLDAPEFHYLLYEAEKSGKWKEEAVDCSSADFVVNDEESWRNWRNSQPDVKLVGEE